MVRGGWGWLVAVVAVVGVWWVSGSLAVWEEKWWVEHAERAGKKGKGE